MYGDEVEDDRNDGLNALVKPGDFNDLEPKKAEEILRKSTNQEDPCSAEICRDTKGDTKVGVECNGYGIGFSTNKQVEVKLGGVTFPIPK